MVRARGEEGDVDQRPCEGQLLLVRSGAVADADRVSDVLQ